MVAGAGVDARVEDRKLAFKTDGSSGNQRFPCGDAGAIDGVAGGEIVGAVEHDVGVLYGVKQGVLIQRAGQGVDADIGIQVEQVVACGFDFRAA